MRRSTKTKHIYNIVTGISICYFNFGIKTVHPVAACLVTWTTIHLLGPSPTMVGVNFVFNMVSRLMIIWRMI